MTFEWRDLVGSHIGGNYQLSEYLGEVGNHGVFSAEGGEEAAIVRVASGAHADQLFERWSSAMPLKHPAVVQTLEAGRTELLETPLVYCATQRPDDSLAEAVAVRALTGDEARDILGSILDGLSYLHAQGFVHGGVAPENVVAIGDQIKLSSWTITRGGPTEMAKDLQAVGETLVEILTQSKPQNQSPADIAALPAPFRQVAKQCATGRCTVKEALQAMRGEVSLPEPLPVRKALPEEPKFFAEKPARAGLPLAAILGAVAAVLLVIFGVRAYTQHTPPTESSRERAAVVEPQQPEPQQPEPQKPSAVAERPVVPPPVAKPVAKKENIGDWAVVGAIYNNYDQAQQRAQSMGRKSKRWQPEVFPPSGQGRRYMVVLGYGHSAKEADQILRKAQADGMPSDAYVTRISR